MDVNFNIGVDLTPLRQGLNEGVDLVEKAGQEVNSGQQNLSKPFKDAVVEVAALNKEIVNTEKSFKAIQKTASGMLLTWKENFHDMRDMAGSSVKWAQYKKEIEATGGEIKKITAVNEKWKQQLVKHDHTVAGATTRVLRLGEQLKQLKNELATGKYEGAEFERMSLKAAQLAEQIEKTNQRIRNLASNTFAIDALISGVQGLTGAFAFGQGVMALFGNENEDLQKALLKVNAATSALLGLQQLQQTFLTESAAKTFVVTTAQKAYATVLGFVNNGLKFNNVQTIANAAATTANATATTGAAVAQGELAVATTTASLSLRIFRLALIATGIGAILVGLGLLIAHWDDLTTAIMGSNEALDKFNKLNSTTDEAIKLTDEATDRRVRKLQLENAENKKLIDAKIDGNKQVIMLSEEELQAAKDLEKQGFANVTKMAENAKRQNELIAIIEERQLQNKEFTKGYYKELLDLHKEELDEEAQDEEDAYKARLEKLNQFRQDVIEAKKVGANDRIAGIELELLTVEKGTIKEIELYNKLYAEKAKLIEADTALTVNQSKLALAQLEQERVAKIKALQQINLVTIQGNDTQLSTIADFYEQEQALNEQRFLTGIIKEKEYQQEKLKILIASLEEQKTHLTAGTAAFINLENEIIKAQQELDGLSKNSLGSIIADLFGISEGELKAMVSAVEQAINAVTDVISQGLQDQINLNEQYINNLDNRIQKTEDALDRELELNKQGFASNVQAKREELAELEAARQEALENQKAALKTQRAIETASQIMSLVTSIANIFKSVSSLGPIGVVIGAVSAAALVAAFIASKVAASNAANAQEFFTGGEYGYTGDGSPYEESRRLGTKPYVYHKKEFIFNHKKTEENIELFRSIHGDNTVGIIKGVEKLLEGTGVTLAPDLPHKTERSVITVRDLVEKNNYESFSNIFGQNFEDLHNTVTSIKKYLDEKVDYIPIDNGRLEAKKGKIVKKVTYKK